MADKKISEFEVAAAINGATKIPVLNSNANFVATLTQFKNFCNTLSSTSVTNANIPLTYNVVGINAACVLPAATSLYRILLIAESAASFTSPSLVGTYSTSTIGSVIELLWYNNSWNVISNNGFTV